ncbi:MAG: CCDC90 family protein [Methylobacter tundripaludum]|nr:CCDC90 family protein [Methylobacter tundripaludum]
MNTLTFDTHEFVKKLKDVGFSEEQAEVITNLQKTTSSNTLEQARRDYDLDNLATKRDLRELELKIELVRSELKRDIAETKAELIRWVVGVGVLQTVLITALVLKLAGTH